MGRSVEVVRGNVAVAYRDATHMGYEHDEDGNIVGDYDDLLGQIEWNEFVAGIVEKATTQWPTMNDVSDENKWYDYPYRETRIIAENELAQITISEYCGCVAICLVPIEHDHYYPEDIAKNNFAENWCNRVSGNFLKLFTEFVRVGGFSDGTSIYEKVS